MRCERFSDPAVMPYRRTNASILHNSHEPPVGIAVVEKDHSISFCCVGLPLDGSDKVMERIDKLEIDIFCIAISQNSSNVAILCSV